MKTPDFLKKKNNKPVFHKPFSVKGKPRKYLGLLAALLDGEQKKKTEILQCIGLNLSNDSARGYFSDYFNDFEHTRILAYKKDKRVWVKGENFDIYFSFVISELCKQDHLRKRFLNLLILKESNFIDLISGD